MYCTYVLKSDKDGNFHVGYSEDLKLRFDKIVFNGVKTVSGKKKGDLHAKPR